MLSLQPPAGEGGERLDGDLGLSYKAVENWEGKRFFPLVRVVPAPCH